MKSLHTTRLSSRGQLVIPKEIRDANGWGENTEFAIEQRKEGVLLVAKRQKTKSLSDIIGIVGTPKKRLTLEELCAPVSNYKER